MTEGRLSLLRRGRSPRHSRNRPPELPGSALVFDIPRTAGFAWSMWKSDQPSNWNRPVSLPTGSSFGARPAVGDFSVWPLPVFDKRRLSGGSLQCLGCDQKSSEFLIANAAASVRFAERVLLRMLRT
jgi:hypothetical protein